MKFAICIGLLVSIAAGLSDSAVVKSPQPRSSLAIGNITVGDRLLMRQYVYKRAMYNTIQTEDVTYQGNATTRVSAVRATEQGRTQYATSWMVSGWIGLPNASVRIQSARGYGYYYLVEFYGRLR